MAELPSTVSVACPRCNDPILCALKSELIPPKPGEKSGREVRAWIPDLATPMRLHYESSGHSAPLPASVQRFSPHVENVIAEYRSEDD